MTTTYAPRRLGSSNILVSPLGMGCMGLTHAYGDPIDEAEAQKTIRASFEAGYTFFDTAESYTGILPDGSTTYNEHVVGQALKDVRDQVVIATKFGVAIQPDHSLVLDSSPATIRSSVEGSLRRLGTDYIDLYYQHRVDPKVDPEEVAGTVGELIAEGKVRAWGISEMDEQYLRRAHAVCPVSAVQMRHSPMARWHEDLFPALEELDIALVAFSPLANGSVAQQVGSHTTYTADGDYRALMPQYTTEGEARSEALRTTFAQIAKAHGATPAQISLAWSLARKPYLIPIPGSRKLSRMIENLESARIELTSDELTQINAVIEKSDFAVFGGNAVRK